MMRSRDDGRRGEIRARRERVPVAERAERLKEEIYLIFTALAVVLVLDSHGHTTPGAAMRTLAFTTAGTLLAVFVADIISHIAVHGRIHSRDELRRALAVSVGAVGAVALPFVFLGIAVAGVWEAHTALTASKIALIAALVAVGWFAVRRVRMAWWKRLIVLGAEAVLGMAVIGLEILAHG